MWLVGWVGCDVEQIAQSRVFPTPMLFWFGTSEGSTPYLDMVTKEKLQNCETKSKT